MPFTQMAAVVSLPILLPSPNGWLASSSQ
jgi:hypothetical protein